MAQWGKTDTLASAPKFVSPMVTFDASSASVVSLTNDTITYGTHVFETGVQVNYTNGGGTAITGLTSGNNYFVIRVDGDTIKLATTLANANAGTAINLTVLGVGAAHTLKVVPAAVFVDVTEAGITSNRATGLRTPGWNLFKTYTDALGNTRRRVEVLVPMKVSATDATDAGVTGAGDDSTVADS